MTAAFGLSLLGTGMSFLSQRAAAKNQQKAGRIAGENAARAGVSAMRRNAQEAVNRLEQARQIENEAIDRIILSKQSAQLARSNIRAKAAVSGATVDVGSINVVNDRITQLEQRDQLVIMYTALEQAQKQKSRAQSFLQAGSRQYDKHYNQGVFDRWNANQQAAQTRMQSYATLINGTANAFSSYHANKNPTTFPVNDTAYTPESKTRMGHFQ